MTDSRSSTGTKPVVTDEMLTAAMRAFELMSSVLRYREKDKWHTCDMMWMRDAIRAALVVSGAAQAAPVAHRWRWKGDVTFNAWRYGQGPFIGSLVTAEAEDLYAAPQPASNAYAAWLPVANYPDDNSAVLVANPEEGSLPVVAWKVEDTWYHYNLGEKKPLDPQPTIWTEWPKMPKASPLSSTERS